MGRRNHVLIMPASHYITTRERMLMAASQIEEELAAQVAYFKSQGKLLEAQRIEQRTRYDLEMIREIGFCKGMKTIPGTSPGENQEHLY